MQALVLLVPSKHLLKRKTRLNSFFRNRFVITELCSFNCQTSKMVKHTQTIRRLLPTNFLRSLFNHFVERVIKGLKNKLNRLHERCFRLIYNDERHTFEQLFDEDSSVSIHISNLLALAIEKYKVVNGSSPYIANGVFKLRDEGKCKLRHKNTFKIPEVNTVQRRIQSPVTHLRWGVLRK